ncbi:hypothetical protein pb186bvf_007654 [Paramecium bursaria]
MGGGNSKKPDPPKPQPVPKQPPVKENPQALRESNIPEYNRPKSPDIQDVKLDDLKLQADSNIDKEAENKRRADDQLRRNDKRNLSKIDDSFERGMDGMNQKDLAELQKRLLDDDLSPINRSISENQKQQINFAKIKKATQKAEKISKQLKRVFDFSKSGSANLISVTFKYGYNWKTKKLTVLRSYDTYVNSQIKWIKNEQNNVYEFKLRDIDVFNLTTGDVTQLGFNEVEYMVDQNGTFVGLKHEDDYLKALKQGQKQLQKDKEQEEQLKKEFDSKQMNNIDRLMNEKLKQKPPLKKKQNPEKQVNQAEKQLEQFWTQTIQQWYKCDDSIFASINYQGQPSYQGQLKQVDTKEKLENFLSKKLQDQAFFKACFESNRTIRDTLKKWNMFSEEEELAYLNEPKYSLISLQKKVSYPILEKFNNIEGTLNSNDFTPQVIIHDQGRKTVIEHNQDLFVDIEHEKKLIVFVWDKQMNSKSKVRTESIFVEELNKFRDLCDQSLKETIFQLSVIPNFPMENRPKGLKRNKKLD